MPQNFVVVFRHELFIKQHLQAAVPYLRYLVAFQLFCGKSETASDYLACTVSIMLNIVGKPVFTYEPVSGLRSMAGKPISVPAKVTSRAMPHGGSNLIFPSHFSDKVPI